MKMFMSTCTLLDLRHLTLRPNTVYLHSPLLMKARSFSQPSSIPVHLEAVGEPRQQHRLCIKRVQLSPDVEVLATQNKLPHNNSTPSLHSKNKTTETQSTSTSTIHTLEGLLNTRMTF